MNKIYFQEVSWIGMQRRATLKWMALKRREEGLLATQCVSSVGSGFTGKTSCISICPRNITPVIFVNGRVFRSLLVLTDNTLLQFASDALGITWTGERTKFTIFFSSEDSDISRR